MRFRKEFLINKDLDAQKSMIDFWHAKICCSRFSAWWGIDIGLCW